MHHPEPPCQILHMYTCGDLDLSRLKRQGPMASKACMQAFRHADPWICADRLCLNIFHCCSICYQAGNVR
jgi:hypothetical protein